MLFGIGPANDELTLQAEIDALNLEKAALKAGIVRRADMTAGLQAKLEAIADAVRGQKSGTARMVLRMTGRG
jgi:hypothetical protein